MIKRNIIAFALIFISWLIIDFILHGVLLCRIYESTASLWRPADQMNIPQFCNNSFSLIIYLKMIKR